MASKTSQYNHTAWWIGGLALVALIVGVFYFIYSGYINKPAVDTVGIIPSDNRGVGSPAPAQVHTAADVKAAESSLDDTDLDAVTADLNQNDADLSTF